MLTARTVTTGTTGGAGKGDASIARAATGATAGSASGAGVDETTGAAAGVATIGGTLGFCSCAAFFVTALCAGDALNTICFPIRRGCMEAETIITGILANTTTAASDFLIFVVTTIL